ncbi:MAG: hypothetical protein JAY74_09060, partial [Candidatus Thiodiazotropha taylori]|nr:hypothetical protein [Candidatus Thiodiazotropha taylori]
QGGEECGVLYNNNNNLLFTTLLYDITLTCGGKTKGHVLSIKPVKHTSCVDYYTSKHQIWRRGS